MYHPIKAALLTTQLLLSPFYCNRGPTYFEQCLYIADLHTVLLATRQAWSVVLCDPSRLEQALLKLISLFHDLRD